jgi:glycosyltransferase involved in cell wall biosynthesis
MNKNNIFIIIPAHNESKNIAQTLQNLLDKNYKNIIVVDDCSTDNTLQIANQFSVHILQHKINRGQGAALQTGTDFALQHDAEIIVHFDADGQFLVSDIQTGLKIIENNFDVAMGSRFLNKKSNLPKIKKYFIFPIAKFVNKIFFNINLTDPQSGFRIFNSQVADKIKFEQDGSAHCSEFLHKIFKNNFKVKEFPITVQYFEFGQTLTGGKGRGKGGIKILKDLFLNNFIK